MEKNIKKILCIYISFIVLLSVVTFVFFDFSINVVACIYISNMVSATITLVGAIILFIMGKSKNEFAKKSPFANMFKKFELSEVILSVIYGLISFFMIKNGSNPINPILYVIVQLAILVILFMQFNAYPLERRFVDPVDYVSRY